MFRAFRRLSATRAAPVCRRGAVFLCGAGAGCAGAAVAAFADGPPLTRGSHRAGHSEPVANPQQPQPRPPAAELQGHTAAGPPAAAVSAWRLARWMLQHLWPEEAGLRLRVVIAVLCVFATKGFNLAVPFMFKGMLDSLTAAPAMSVLRLVLIHGICRILRDMTQEARSYLFAPVVQRAMRTIAVQVFRHLHDLGLDFHLSRQTGSLQGVIDSGVQAVERMLHMMLFIIVPTSFEFALAAGALWRQAGLPFVALAVAAVVAYVTFTVRVSEWRIGVRKRMNSARSAASAALVDSLVNYETVKYFQQEEHEAGRYDALKERFNAASALTEQSLRFLNLGQQLIISGAMTAATVMSAARVASGTMTPGDLVFVDALLLQLSRPLNFLGTAYREARNAFVDLRGLFRLLDQRSGVQQADDAPDFVFRGGRIEFADVHFSYGAKEEALRGVSFVVPEGTSTGIVGTSGCAKTTILRLLFRFYDPSSGVIRVDGQDACAVRVDSLRAAMGVIPQDCVLFNDSLRHNIQYGRLGASDAEVKAAARDASLEEAIQKFPKGYETKVGERGLKLSGGEKQRVAIARCLLRGAPILLADEATSALDSRTEAMAVAALRRNGSGTALIVAHRLSTVKGCDEILVMDSGRIVERGTHEDLVRLGGLYTGMWARQQQEEERQVQGVPVIAAAGAA